MDEFHFIKVLLVYEGVPPPKYLALHSKLLLNVLNALILIFNVVLNVLILMLLNVIILNV